MRPVAQLALLVAAAGLLGTAAQFVSPTRIPWRENWSTHVQTKALRAGLRLADTADAQRLLESGSALIVDARSPRDYDSGRLPGALSLPDSQRSVVYPEFADLLTREPLVLVYCSGLSCDESLNLCLFLKDQGHTNLVLYAGGIQAWKEAGLPLER